MRTSELPERWSQRLREYLRNELGKNRDTLSANDFRHSLRIDFDDGSFAVFRYAFYLTDRDLNEVAVFTEHCGYHIFPLGDATLEWVE